MKFLVIGKPTTREMPPESRLAIYQAARQVYQDWVEDGIVDRIYGLTAAGGVAIMNADSPEQLWDALSAWPLYPYGTWEVHPLTDYAYVLDKYIERLQERS